MQHGFTPSSPLSFIPQLVGFQIHIGVQSVPLLCGSPPPGKATHVWRNLSLLWLTTHQWWRWISALPTCQPRQMTPFGAWKCTLASPFSCLKLQKTNPNSQEMEKTSNCCCAHFDCNLLNPQNKQNAVRGDRALIWVHGLWFMICSNSGGHTAGSRCVPRNKKRQRRSVVLPSVTLLTPCYLKETTGGRNLSPAVFHRTHLSSPHHMSPSWSFLQTQCAHGSWRSYLITSSQIKSIILYFIFIAPIIVLQQGNELMIMGIQNYK